MILTLVDPFCRSEQKKISIINSKDYFVSRLNFVHSMALLPLLMLVTHCLAITYYPPNFENISVICDNGDDINPLGINDTCSLIQI